VTTPNGFWFIVRAYSDRSFLKGGGEIDNPLDICLPALYIKDDGSGGATSRRGYNPKGGRGMDTPPGSQARHQGYVQEGQT